MMSVEQTKQMERLAAERQPFVVATVVRARRPTSVRPGDGAIVRADGTIEGFVGGVCAESSVRLHALRALETGEPLLLRLVPGDVEGEGGLPELTEGAVVEHNPCLSGGSLEIFIEPHLPANRVVVVGNSPIARALVQLACAGDYDCSLGSPADAGRLEGASAVVVASHGNGEEDVLSAALQAGVPYVALVASPKRGRVVRAELTVAPELAAQLHTPAGLDIGARTPTEIAISVLAEMVAVHHAHPGPIEVGQSPEVDVNGAREVEVNGAREISVSTPAVAGVAIDPVCGMKVATVAAGLHLDVDGETVWFCGEGCRASYQREHALG
jgi:xanthine dehydrogenase accessory factor